MSDSYSSVKAPDFLITKSELDNFLGEIRRLEVNVYKTKSSFEELLKQTLSASTLEFVKSYLGQTTDPKEVLKKTGELIAQAQKIEVVSVTLAFEPTQVTIKKIHQWFVGNLKRPIVLALHNDPKILGGAVIELEGKWGDFSLRRKIDDHFRENKEKIMQQVKI